MEISVLAGRPGPKNLLVPSHNPPEDGGFKYNPPNGGPADTDVTRWVQDRANELYAESFKDQAHLDAILSEARETVNNALNSTPRHGGQAAGRP